MVTALKYSGEISINPVVGNAGVHVFSMNGMYDPDITGTGHQPRGFDQLMALYSQYTVIGCKIKTDYIVASAEVIRCGITPMSTSVPYITVNDYRESRATNQKVINESTAANRDRSIYHKMNPTKWLGKTKPLSDGELSGTSAANPVNQAYWHLWCGGFQSSDPSSITVEVDLVYMVVFHKPIQPLQS